MTDITVLMTVYNGGPYLRPAVESILTQTYRDFEFLIVDNASTDGSVPYLQSQKDPRVRVICLSSNQGQTRALNVGIRESSGRYLARMDADDVSQPGRLGVQRAYLEAHPKAAVVGSWTKEIDPQDHPLKVMKYPTDPLAIRCHLLSDGDLTRRCIAHPSVMMVRSSVLEAGGYDESVAYAQDYDLWTRVARRSEIHNIGQVLLQYRSFPESASKRNLSAMTQELDSIVKRNVKALWPEIAPADVQRLVHMLRNQTPLPGENRQSLYALFDLFFDCATRSWQAPAGPLRKWRERIKAYYAPRLFQRAPLGVGLWTAGTLVRQPDTLIDPKWLKNIAKRMV